MMTICLASIFTIGIGISSRLNTNFTNQKDEIKIMSYNLYFKNRTPSNSITIIKEANPDILFVQELTPKWASELKRELSDQYKYKYSLIKPLKGTHGIGIYSKQKISNQVFLNNSGERPFAQIAELSFKDKKIQLINTHLASPAIAVENRERFFQLFLQNYKVRKNQIIALNQIAEKDAKSYDSQLLVGDLNTLQSEPIFHKLKLKWTTSVNHSLRWMKFSFPNSGKVSPFMSLDYILGRGNIRITNFKVLEGGSSDHQAIMSSVKL